MVRDALELRYKLLPYLYAKFWEAHESGAPVQRPLLYDFQHDPTARDRDDQFLLGDALLVAPVLQAGVTARSVYLPAGTWYDWYTDQAHPGQRYVTAPAPLDRIPLFARGGAVIACFAQAPLSTKQAAQGELELHLFVPQEDGELRSSLHEDDGTSKAYQQGAFLRTTFTTTRTASELRVRATVTGQGYAEHQRQSFTLVLHGPAQEIRINGHPVSATAGRIHVDNPGVAFELTARVS
jgi:alpha-glucosidase